MLFPFRTSAIFRNRWVALLWAAGICFTAVEIADGVSGVTERAKPSADVGTNAGPTPGDVEGGRRATPVEPNRILK